MQSRCQLLSPSYWLRAGLRAKLTSYFLVSSFYRLRAGLHEPRMGFQAEDLSRGRQLPHLNLTPSSDLQQLQQDATPEASGSNPYRCLLLSQTFVII